MPEHHGVDHLGAATEHRALNTSVLNPAPGVAPVLANVSILAGQLTPASSARYRGDVAAFLRWCVHTDVRTLSIPYLAKQLDLDAGTCYIGRQQPALSGMRRSDSPAQPYSTTAALTAGNSQRRRFSWRDL